MRTERWQEMHKVSSPNNSNLTEMKTCRKMSKSLHSKECKTNDNVEKILSQLRRRKRTQEANESLDVP